MHIALAFFPMQIKRCLRSRRKLSGALGKGDIGREAAGVGGAAAAAGGGQESKQGDEGEGLLRG